MAKRNAIERNLHRNVTRRRNRTSWTMIVLMFACAILLVACMGYLRSNKPAVVDNSLSGDFMMIETPDSTSYRYDYEGFSIYFNPTWRVPSAVIYELTREEQEGNLPRESGFKRDMNIARSAYDKDYVRSGYDRGHMAPSADMNWDRDVIKQSFLLTNVAPQNGQLNRGQWKGLETKIRQWGERDSALVIVTGTIFNGDVETIGRNDVGVPTQLYKIVFAPYVAEPRMIAYLYDNIKPINPASDYVVTVDEIERLTGNDFFPTLPNHVERELERESNLQLWNLDE